MKKINLKGISEILSEKEMKNVLGGSLFCNDCSGNMCWSQATGDGYCKRGSNGSCGCIQ